MSLTVNVMSVLFTCYTNLLMHPSSTLSCLVAIRGFIGNKSEAAFPALNTMSLMQPTNDSMMYFTPWSFSSGLRPDMQLNNYHLSYTFQNWSCCSGLKPDIQLHLSCETHLTSWCFSSGLVPDKYLPHDTLCNILFNKTNFVFKH